MSIEIYRPNGPNTEPSYPIGTVGMEPIKPNGIFGEILDAARTAFPPFNLAYLTLSAILTKGDSAVPTYGLWGGKGWSGGRRGRKWGRFYLFYKKKPQGHQHSWRRLSQCKDYRRMTA